MHTRIKISSEDVRKYNALEPVCSSQQTSFEIIFNESDKYITLMFDDVGVIVPKETLKSIIQYLNAPGK